MKKIKNFFVAIATWFVCIICYADEPKNLDIYKQKLVQYYHSGAYAKDQAKTIHQAMAYLKARLQQPNKKPLALIIDIDETALSNYPHMVEMRFGGTETQVNEAKSKGTDPVIKPTLEFFRFAKDHHLAVFFVTGRPESLRSATEKNLEIAGYRNWNGLLLKPDDYQEKSIANFKINARKQIKNQGYDIVLNLGDQQSDLRGKASDKTFKMPNPFYVTQ